MGTEQIVVAAVVMDKSILEGEGVEPARRFRIPGNLLGARRQASLRSVLLDHHNVLVASERISDAIGLRVWQETTETELPAASNREVSCIAFCIITP